MIPDLTNPQEIKRLLKKHEAMPKRSMGQNFLICPEVIEATLIAAQEGPKNVTELGGGLGVLAQALISDNYMVRTIEKDDILANIIPSVIPAKKRANLEVIHADMLKTEWSWQEDYQLIGNVPYNISGYIIRQLAHLAPAPRQAIFLFQSEVADRLSAKPPHMSLLSLAAALWGETYKLLRVPPSCFWPAPTVSSQLILIAPHKDPLPPDQIERVLDVARPFFQQKRKQMGGILQRELNHKVSLLEEAGINPSARPQELSVLQWEKLTNEIREQNV